MTNSIPKRGPATIKLSNGSLELFYIRETTRMWVVQQLDAEGNQIGPEANKTALYVHSREDAVAEMEAIIAADQLVIVDDVLNEVIREEVLVKDITRIARECEDKGDFSVAFSLRMALNRYQPVEVVTVERAA